MKNLTFKELLAAPASIHKLYVLIMSKRPVSSQMIEDAMKEHPQYFPEELEKTEVSNKTYIAS